MSKTIRIDEDLFKILKKEAIPLEDTASDVLRRIFERANLLPPRRVRVDSVDELELSVRTYNLLKNHGIKTVKELTKRSKSSLAAKGFGSNSISELEETLASMKLSFAKPRRRASKNRKGNVINLSTRLVKNTRERKERDERDIPS